MVGWHLPPKTGAAPALDPKAMGMSMLMISFALPGISVDILSVSVYKPAPPTPWKARNTILSSLSNQIRR